jgi:prophage antirepressor-like protein
MQTGRLVPNKGVLEMSTQIAINGWSLVSSGGLEGHWMTGEEIGKHLGYSEPRDAVNVLYNRHKNSFKDGVDTCTLKLKVQLQARDTRIFSERGVLKVIRYSNTEVANAVMNEVFDVYLAVRKKAKEQTAPMVPTVPVTIEDKATNIISNWMQVATIFKAPEHYAQAEATKAARLKTGVDYTPLLLAAPAQDDIPEEDMALEVSEIGDRLEMSGQGVNEFLGDQHLQYKKGKVWEATAEGKRHSQAHHWVAGNKSGYNLKWKFTFIKTLWIKAGCPRKKKKSKKAKPKTQAGQKVFF